MPSLVVVFAGRRLHRYMGTVPIDTVTNSRAKAMHNMVVLMGSTLIEYRFSFVYSTRDHGAYPRRRPCIGLSASGHRR